MKASELRQQSQQELQGLSRDLSRKLWKARFGNYSGQLDDTSQIPQLRRDIARVKTVIAELGRGAGDAKGARSKKAATPATAEVGAKTKKAGSTKSKAKREEG